MSDIAIKIENLKKQYKLGTIGGTTLNAELQSWWARKRGKEDPNLKLGEEQHRLNESFWALDGINLEVKKGEALGIIGTNGAGKSTLLKVLSRVTAPTEGDVWINGRISSMLEVGTGFNGELTGRENIYMNGAILGMSKKEVDAKMDSIIEFSECGQFIDTPVKRYSSGMYVKLAFAVASHLDADIMIMDEVLAVGDMKFQKKCLGKMGDAAGNDGKTILYVSHNMATIRNLCTRCVVLNKGKIIFDGDTEDAIQIYLGNVASDLKTVYNFENIKKINPDYGQNAKIISVRLLNKNIATYTNDEKIQMEICGCVLKKDCTLKIGCSMKYVDLSSIGFTETLKQYKFHVGEKFSVRIQMDVSLLVKGTYAFYLELFQTDELNFIHGMDQVGPIFFEITEEWQSGVEWLRQYWGNIRFKMMEEINEGNLL